MLKKLLSVILTIFLFSGILFSSGINNSYAAGEDEGLTTKVLFFNNFSEIKNFENELKNYKKLEFIKDFTTFDKFNALSITGNCNIMNSIISSLGSKVTVVNDFEFKALPIKVSSERGFSEDLWNLTDIGVKALWDKGFTGKGVKVGILDTGIDPGHIALKGKLVDWAEFSPSGSLIEGSKPYDSDGHGTHVSGIAVGGSVNEPLGVAPDASLSFGLVIPRGGGTFSQILGGLEWILDPDKNPFTNDSPKVVNMSLGAIGYYKIWTSIFNKLLSNNVLPVCAIGNESDGISSSPGNCPNVIGVGAYDKNTNPAYFSSGNDTISWEEDNLSVTYTKPDISAPGVSIYSSIPGNKYAKWSGTSMATPHITGAVALLIQAFPDTTSYDIMYFLKRGAVDVGKSGVDSRFGFGKLNLENTYNLLSESKKVYGKIENFRDGLVLYNTDINSPVYVDKEGNFSTHLLPGTYKLELKYGDKLLKTSIINVKGDNLNVNIEAPMLKKVLFEGVVKSEDGIPLKAKLFIGSEQFLTDGDGRFSIYADSLDTALIIASGYESRKINLDSVREYLNIRLKKTSILLIEGVSPYITITNPPRLARNYYFDALYKLGRSYTYINSEITSFSFEDLKSYSSVIYFCDSGGISYEDEKELSKYLDNGGRLLITGRIILSLENYYRQTFITDYFDAGSKESMSFPSVCGFEKSNDFQDFLFTLSGDEGANNQEVCDVITIGDKDIAEPILQYVEFRKGKYAGVKVSNGLYKGVLLGFGIEGIGSNTQRLLLLEEILDWFDSSKRLECLLPENSNFRVNVIRSDNKQFAIFTSGETFQLKNLENMKYRFVFEGYGYQISQFEIDFSKNDVCFIELHPEKSPFYKVNVSLKNVNSLETAFADIIYMGKRIDLIKFNPKEPLSLSLPLGYFEILIIAKNYAPKIVRAKVDDSDLNFSVDMEQNQKKVLLVDDSKTGDFFIDNYIRIGDAYTKVLSTTKITYDIWIVSKSGQPTFTSLLPYDVILYVTGRNFYALEKQKDRDEIIEYLKYGGNIAICGNTAHIIMRDSPFLRDYFGVNVKNCNIRESTLVGESGTKLSGLIFDLYDPLVQGTTYITFPSLEPVSDGVKPLFRYLSGAISTTLFEKQNFRSIMMPFGIDNVYSSETRQKILTGLIYTLSGENEILSNSDISYKSKD
jgi:hypothetical protein